MAINHSGDRDSYTVHPGITVGNSHKFATKSNKVGEIKDCNNPVYLGKNGKNIMYDAEGMQTGKIYGIRWMGENWALKKTKDSIEFYKFEPKPLGKPSG